jgi:hypothetical protein
MDVLENGLVNLAAIVGTLILCIGLIPLILIKGSPAPPSHRDSSSSD